MAVRFPDQLTQADLEILVKEWTLTGAYVYQTTYWVGFIEHELSTSWTEFYVGKAHDEDAWVKADLKGAKTGKEAKKVAWLYWVNRPVRDPNWKVLLDYVEGELDYKLEEFIDDPEDSEFTAEDVIDQALENLAESLVEVRDEFKDGLDDYGQ